MIFQIQCVFHKFNLNYDVQNIIFYYIFSHYKSIIYKYWFSHFQYKCYIYNNIKSFPKISMLDFVYYDVFNIDIAILFYRTSIISRTYNDFKMFFPLFFYLKEFFLFKNMSWNLIKYDTKNIAYKLSKKSRNIFYNKFKKFIK